MRKRILPFLLSAAMTVSLMPYTAFAADSGQQYQDGTYEAVSTQGFGGKKNPVKVKVTIKDGRITGLESPEHKGESYWDTQDVDSLLKKIVGTDNNIDAVMKGLNVEGGIDGVTGATYSSTAVVDATQKAIEQAKVTDQSDKDDSEPAEVHRATGALYNNSYIGYAEKVPYDNTFVDPDLTYTVDKNGDYVFTMKIKPAEDVKVSKWDDRTMDFTADDFEGVRYSQPATYKSGAMKLIEDKDGIKTFQFTMSAEDMPYLTEHAMAFALTFETTAEKQKELGSLSPISCYMGIELADAADDTSDDETTGEYVLMNIPYDEFYAAEVDKDGVDAVTSATLNGKARNENVNGASYHRSEEAVSTEGIAGSIYPVKISDPSVLDTLKAKGAVEVTDADTLSYEMTARGKTSTVNLSGAEVLAERPDYSYYVLDKAPASYKELTVAEDGTVSFSETKDKAAEGTAEGSVKVGGFHTDIEIPLTLKDADGNKAAADPDDVSGVVITADNGKKYALHHVVNIWRGSEIGWNISDIELNGGKVTNIRYYMKDGSVVDYKADLEISDAGYVLMNIPYNDFYKAELSEGSPAVDAVTSATKKKPLNKGLAGGSYHKNADGSDISGVTYPVLVTDMSLLKGYTAVDKEDALFNNDDYAYMKLDTKPAKYKTLTAGEDGALSFSKTGGRATAIKDAKAKINTNDHHVDIAINLSGTTTTDAKGNTVGVALGDTVSAVVVKTDEGKTYGLQHLTNIWRGTSLGFHDGEDLAKVRGHKITNITIYTQDAVYSYDLNAAEDGTAQGVYVPLKAEASLNVEGAETAAGTTGGKLTGQLPDDFAPEYSANIEGSQVTNDNGSLTITYPKDVLPGQYTVTVKDKNGTYQDITANLVLSSKDMPAAYNGDNKAPALEAAEGAADDAFANYIKNINKVTVDGVDYKTGHHGTTIVKKDGSLDLEVKDSKGNKILDPSKSHKVVVDATGYTVPLEFTVAGSGKTDNGSGDSSTAPARHKITVSETENGTVSARPETANKGTKVTVTAKANGGYEVDAVTVKDAEGKDVAVEGGNGTYTFDMPDSDVTVTAAFKKVKETKPDEETKPEIKQTFDDVAPGAWYFNAVENVAKKGLMVGTGDRIFSPDMNVSRAMIATIVYNMEGRPVATKSAGFTDVPDGQWYTDAVNWAAENGIVVGFGNGKFGPTQDITREQFAMILYKYAQKKGIAQDIQGGIDSFKDAASVSDWAKEAVAWAVNSKVMAGSDDMLNPQGTATRAQAAQLITAFGDIKAK